MKLFYNILVSLGMYNYGMHVVLLCRIVLSRNIITILDGGLCVFIAKIT